MKRTLISLAAVAAIGLTMSACNTISGMGADVSRGGQAVQDASAKVRVEWREWRIRHDRDYDSARQTCGTNPERNACLDKTRAEYRAALHANRTKYRRAEFRAANERERMEDAYEATRDACYTLSGAEEDRCLADARARYPH